MKVLGERIRSLRLSQGFSQKEVAHAIGVSNVQLSRYESGDRKPDAETIKDLADFFDVSTDYLLGRADNPVSLALVKQEDHKESLFFFDQKSITEEEAQALNDHLKYLRAIAKKVNKDD
ncbi:helix-turn-helix domain-containing protein [Bacillus sp. SCS-151]|uniref:helix-turn-helix domain-containing protein n=1 Tax=Nanhaiella sioensis TaxID=3115293 RepID=UPI00397997A8